MEKELISKSCKRKFIVAGCKQWNQRIFKEIINSYSGEWKFVDNPEQLNSVLINYKPEYIFFLHWSWIVSNEIINKYECVCFHMADVPYGRGGSPLQNLIFRGHRYTKLTALRMVQELDAGPVYMKRDLSLEGNAEEIYIRATYLSAEMIKEIIETLPTPIPQSGEVVMFKRRTPDESVISKLNSLVELYDFIRMLDAEGYPKAFIEYNGFRYEFFRANLYEGCIEADVKIILIKEDKQ
jgi:methionyl-tRNA formyltransferase